MKIDCFVTCCSILNLNRKTFFGIILLKSILFSSQFPFTSLTITHAPREKNINLLLIPIKF